MSPEDLAFIGHLAQSQTGMTLRGDKAFFVESRLGPVARRQGFDSVEALIARLKAGADDRLVQAVCEALAVTDTAFFRDPQVFEYLAANVLPDLLATRPDGRVQVWCAGCATGQEAYSLAILGQELQAKLPGLSLEIIATDLSQRALEKAHAGLYTQFEVQRGLPVRYMLKYFEKTDEMWAVAPDLKAMVRWRRLNLVQARRSLRAFDLVLCRNVASYLEPAWRARVLEQFDPALAPDGALVLGVGEAPPTGFEFGAPALGVFSRRLERGQAAA